MKTMKMISFKFYLIVVKVRPKYAYFLIQKKDQKQFHIVLLIKDKILILFQIIKVLKMKRTNNLNKLKIKVMILLKILIKIQTLNLSY